jgi:hypothetical protein
MISTIVRIALLGSLAALPLAAQGHDHAAGDHDAVPGLGSVTLPATGAATAQPAFLRGVALLHNFH